MLSMQNIPPVCGIVIVVVLILSALGVENRYLGYFIIGAALAMILDVIIMWARK